MPGPGELRYALNLADAGFVGPLRNAAVALGGFLGVSLSVGAALQKIFGQIEQGGTLKDLAGRISETAGTVHQLQFAFQQSGVAAGNVAPAALALQRALSGVSETGEATLDSFRALGTSVEQLRGLSTTDALLKLFEGANKLGRDDAAGAFGKIFGRGISGDMLQLARDAEGFKQALKDSSAQASVFNRMADAFDKIGDTIGTIRMKFGGIATEAAAAFAPAIQMAADALNSIDFERIGQTIRAISNSFKEGRFAELLEAGINMAVEQGGNFFQATFAGSIAFISQRMIDTFQRTPKILGAALSAAFNTALGGFSLGLAEIFAAIGKDSWAGKLSEISANALERAMKAVPTAMREAIGNATDIAGAAKAFADAFGANKNVLGDAALQEWNRLVAELAGDPDAPGAARDATAPARRFHPSRGGPARQTN